MVLAPAGVQFQGLTAMASDGRPGRISATSSQMRELTYISAVVFPCNLQSQQSRIQNEGAFFCCSSLDTGQNPPH